MIPGRGFGYLKHKLRGIPSKLRRLPHRLQETLRRRGAWGTLRACISKIDETVRSGAATRKWAKYWEQEFDRKHGVRTEYHISLDDLDVWDRTEFRIGYEPTNPAALRTILNELQISYDDFVFIDLGSGMGRAVLAASEFPFKKIVGVEYSSELHSVAEENVRNFWNPNQKCHNIELVCADAVDYTVPAENTVFYLYNPFQGPVMLGVLKNIQRSLEDAPREILITYFNAHHNLLEMAPFLERVQSGFEANNPFVVYRNKDNSQSLRRNPAGPASASNRGGSPAGGDYAPLSS